MQPVPQREQTSLTQRCEVCKLQPLPQSAQYMILIFLQIFVVIINFKISLILLLLGYFFSKTVWVCPMCKRQVQVSSQKQQSTKQHIIIRLNDFMILVSKVKYRIVSIILVVLLTYSIYTPRVNIEKTWKSIVTNCGYEVYIDNSFRSKYLYRIYEDTYDWQLQGIFLSKHKQPNTEYSVIKVKMNPTQFKDPNAQDIHLLCSQPKQTLEVGDLIKFKGEWSGRVEHIMVFLGEQVTKMGKKINIQKQVQVMTHGRLRQHST